MKIINPVSPVHNPVQLLVEEYKPNWLMRLCGLKPRMGRWVKNPLPTGPYYGNALIDFELAPATISQCHPNDVAFGNVLYTGIVPHRHINDNVWECMVTNVRVIEIETAYKPFDNRQGAL